MTRMEIKNKKKMPCKKHFNKIKKHLTFFGFLRKMFYGKNFYGSMEEEYEVL